MINLRFIPETQRRQEIINASFAYDEKLSALKKDQKGAPWSQTLRSWYFTTKEFRLDSFYQAMKVKIHVDYSKLEENTSTPKSIISKPSNNKFAPLQVYKEQLILKSHSQNTIKTYSSCFLKFMAFFENKSIDLLTKKDIKTFLLYLIQERKVCSYTQNQYINAIKFYYEKVLMQPKMVITIDRLNKNKSSPNLLSKKEVFRLLSKRNNIKHRNTIALIYSAGLRRSELINLKLTDIDSCRNSLFLKAGKGAKDRQSVVSENQKNKIRDI